MNRLINNIINHWNWLRVIRLAIGGYVLYGGIKQHDNLMLFFGGLFLVQAIFNLGCSNCSSSNCEIKSENSDED